MKAMKTFLFVPWLLLAAMAGCENSKNAVKPAAVSQNVSGLWKLSFDVGVVINMTFEQDTNSMVQGVGTDSGGNAWSFSGKLSDDQLTGKTIPDMSINALVDTNVMAGTYIMSTSHGSFTGARQ